MEFDDLLNILHCGYCETQLLPEIPDNTVHSLVTDPPAGISILTHEWDGDKGGRDEWIHWMRGIMAQVTRVLRPGAYGVVWALPRTSHWTAMALENAGLEIRDVITHHFSSGYPGSRDIGKEILKKGEEMSGESKLWTGWWTNLKPGSEHWILVRKPPEGTTAENVIKWGVGAINIDATRLLDGDGNSGRWPPNVIYSHRDECRLLGVEHKLTSPGGKRARWKNMGIWGEMQGRDGLTPQGQVGADIGYSDEEGFEPVEVWVCAPGCAVAALEGQQEMAARFFYVAKAHASERWFHCAVCDSYQPQSERKPHEAHAMWCETCGVHFGDALHRGHDVRCELTFHPAQKSIGLMQRFIRLVTPPNGIVLDPFAGTGTTLIAAQREGMRWMACEQDQMYTAIAQARMRADQTGESQVDRATSQAMMEF